MEESYYSKFKRVYETSDSIEANEYLELGWVLLNVIKTQIAEESWNNYYILGWNKESEELQRGRTYSQRIRAGLSESDEEQLVSGLFTMNGDEPF